MQSQIPPTKVLSRPRSIAIITRTILTKRVLETTEAILKHIDGIGIQLFLKCVMVGVGDGHGRIGNYPGLFEKMRATLSGLRKWRKRYPVDFGLKTKVQPDNVTQL